jgi:hypothetical protein
LLREAIWLNRAYAICAAGYAVLRSARCVRRSWRAGTPSGRGDLTPA